MLKRQGAPLGGSQDQSPLDGFRDHVTATVKERARPWRAIIALAFALAAAAVSGVAGGKFTHWTSPAPAVGKIVTGSAAAAFCAFAVVAVTALGDGARRSLEPKVGTGHAAVVRYTILLAGGVFTLVAALALLKVPVGQLVVGGALTTILIGIAAQQSLSNVFAGIVLLLSRPFTVGDEVVLRSGAMNGPIEGTVTGIGITYVVLVTTDGVLHLPNSQVLAAGVGRPRPATGPPGRATGPHPPGGGPPGSPAVPGSP